MVYSSLVVSTIYVLKKFWKANITPQELKATRSDAVILIVKRDIEWWLNDCFSDGLADSLNEVDLTTLGVSDLNQKKY
jgi:hypothetical protein